jgi:hypothetical protein
MAASGADDASPKKQQADKAQQSIHETTTGYTLSLLTPHPLICVYPFIKESIRNIYIDFINPPPRI